MLHAICHAINLLYPNTCGICGKIEKESLCKKCEIKLKKKFFMKIENYEKDNTKYFDEHIYFSNYDDIIREKIIHYKFNGKAHLNNFFSKIILKNEKMYIHLKKYDIIIPVPIHKKRKQKRGYNQSELIAINISQKTNKHLLTDILLKTKNIQAQSTLNKRERVFNVKGVYKVQNAKKIINKTILLIDDVYTTGSTLNECAKVLKQMGAKDIGVLTIAKD